MSDQTSEEIDAKSVLDLPMATNDAEASTVREYLIALLRAVWREKEGFSGKRPFGNSSWHWDLYVPLVRAGLISGTLDDDGFIETCDQEVCESIIAAAIEALTA